MAKLIPEGGNKALALVRALISTLWRLVCSEGDLGLCLPGVGTAGSFAFRSAVYQGFSENFQVFFWVLFEQPWKPLGLIS